MKKPNQNQSPLTSLAARLTAFRKAKGLTKYRLAKLSRVSENYIYRYERGLVENPRRDTLQKLAQGLGITLSELIAETAPSDIWQLVEQSLKAYIPVYAGVEHIEPIDFVACTRARTPPTTMRAYRSDTLRFYPSIRPNDTVIVDTALSAKNGDLVIAIKDGQALIEKYKEDRSGNKWLEDNRRHYDLDAMSIHAVITHHIHSFR